MNNSVKTITKNASALMLSQLITWGMALVLMIFLPRYLGAVGVGKFQLATSLWAIVSIVVSFGMDTYMTREIDRAPEKASLFFSATLTLQFVQSHHLCARYAVAVAVKARVAEKVAGTVVSPLTCPCTEGEAATASLFARVPIPVPENHNCAAATLEKTCIPVDAPENPSAADDVPTFPSAPVAEPVNRSVPADTPIGALYPVAEPENVKSANAAPGAAKPPEPRATG